MLTIEYTGIPRAALGPSYLAVDGETGTRDFNQEANVARAGMPSQVVTLGPAHNALIGFGLTVGRLSDWLIGAKMPSRWNHSRQRLTAKEICDAVR